MAEQAVRDGVERRDATRPDPNLRVRRFGPWVGIGLVGSVLRPGTSTPAGALDHAPDSGAEAAGEIGSDPDNPRAA